VSESMDEPELLFAGRFVELWRRGRWEYASRPKAHEVVAVVARTEEDEYLLVEQFRPAVQKTVIEWPAGLAGDGDNPGEDLRTAAARELEEETGYRAAEWRELATLYASAGIVTESATLFSARGLERVSDGGGVDGENIVLHRVPAHEMRRWLRDQSAQGRGIDARVYAGLDLVEGQS
jgi:ADP-ribose diphosphatase